MMRSLLIAAALCASGAPLYAETFTVRGTALVDSALGRGEYWGLAVSSALHRLDLSSSSVKRGPEPWILKPALRGLWRREVGGIDLIEISSEAWIVAESGDLLGYLVKVPISDWDAYELAIRKRFGEPDKPHLLVSPGAGIDDGPRFLHFYRWTRARTQVLFIKATYEDSESYWHDQGSDTALRVRLMQKAQDEDVPLFIGIFDERRSLAGPSRRDLPPYFVPLTP